MNETSDALVGLVRAAEPRFRAVPATEQVAPLLKGGWSRKQVLGHLIDSASNNHQRFVRAVLQSSLEFPGYQQDDNVRMEAPQEADWDVLVDLWAAYNRYLAHIIARVPQAKLDTPCRIGSGHAVTLGFLIEDYLRHLIHHLEQLGVTARR